MKETLAICSVVYENYSILKDFLSSLKKQDNQSFHLYLADLSQKKQKIDDNSLPLTVLDSVNLGYAHGINLGIKKALKDGCRYFCIINDDTYFGKEFAGNVIKTLKNHPASIVGGKIYYAPGYEFHKSRYGKSELGKVIWYAGGRTDWKNVTTPHIGVDEVDTGQYDSFSGTDFVTGCLMALDKQVVDRVGFISEDYFLYYEDADYCERAKKNNIRLFYDPSLVIWHKNAQSTEGSGSQIHQKFQRKNRLKFGFKYAPLRTKVHLIKNLFNISI